LPSDFVKEGLDDQLRTDGLLTSPSEVITLDYKKKDGTTAKWILTLGQDKGEEVYLYTNQRPTVYKTSKGSIDPVRVDAAYFRDGKAPFQFDVELARTVVIQSEKFHHKFVKTDSGWTVEGTDLHLDSEKLVQLMTILRSLEAREFIGTSGTGFKKVPQIEVLGDKGKLLFSLAWADEYKAKSRWNSGTRLRYARTSASGETLGVEASKLDHLIDPALVQKKAEAK
jgi:hypothetical protein